MPVPVPPLAARTPSMTPDKKRTTEDDEVRPYVIVTDIGKGSFATVYRGYHEVRIRWHARRSVQTDPEDIQETHHQVAIKVVRRDILNAKLLDNLQSEIEILKSLSHRHITKLIDIVVRDITGSLPL